jgi:hypothetical protein
MVLQSNSDRVAMVRGGCQWPKMKAFSGRSSGLQFDPQKIYKDYEEVEVKVCQTSDAA